MNPTITNPIRIKQLQKLLTHPSQAVRIKANEELALIAYGNKEFSSADLGFDVFVSNLARQVLVHGFIPAEVECLIHQK